MIDNCGVEGLDGFAVGSSWGSPEEITCTMTGPQTWDRHVMRKE